MILSAFRYSTLKPYRSNRVFINNLNLSIFQIRPMSSESGTRRPAPIFQPFNLALIQLGQIGSDKSGTQVLCIVL